MKQKIEYDLYLTRGCNVLPDLEDQANVVPFLLSPPFQQWLMSVSSGDLGFLQLNLARIDAEILLKRLRVAGAHGSIVRADYRHAKLTLADAYVSALRELEEYREREPVPEDCSDLHVYCEQVECWTFIASSATLLAEGAIPGGLLFIVDKLDGHIWRPEELTDA